jgi:hypothetical protein
LPNVTESEIDPDAHYNTAVGAPLFGIHPVSVVRWCKVKKLRVLRLPGGNYRDLSRH